MFFSRISTLTRRLFITRCYTSDVSLPDRSFITPMPQNNNQPYYNILSEVCHNDPNNTTTLSKEFNDMILRQTKNILLDYVWSMKQHQKEDFITKYPKAIRVISDRDITHSLITRLINIYGKEQTYHLLSQLSFAANCNGLRYNFIYNFIRRGLFCESDKYFETLELLFDIGFDVNTRDNDGLTFLMIACLCKDHEHGYKMAKILLERNADTTPKDRNGYTALDIAINKNNGKIIKLFEKK